MIHILIESEEILGAMDERRSPSVEDVLEEIEDLLESGEITIDEAIARLRDFS